MAVVIKLPMVNLLPNKKAGEESPAGKWIFNTSIYAEQFFPILFHRHFG